MNRLGREINKLRREGRHYSSIVQRWRIYGNDTELARREITKAEKEIADISTHIHRLERMKGER